MPNLRSKVVALASVSAAAIILALLPFILLTYQIIFLISIFTYLILTISWAIFSGYTGYISLAHTAFFGIGSFVCIFAMPFMPFPLAIALGGAMSVAVGLLVGLLTLRLRGLYFAIFSFVVSLFAKDFFIYGVFGQAKTAGVWIAVMPDVVIYYSLLTVALGAILVSAWLRHSSYGLAIAGIGQDELKAETVGINTKFFKITTFCMSAAFAGIAGAISVQRFLYVDPPIAFSLRTTFEPAIMAIVGGAGTFGGPIVGAVIIGVASELIITRFPTFYFLSLGVLLVVFVVLAPKGLVGTGWPTRLRKRIPLKPFLSSYTPR